jgi:hypothetical protein
VLINGTTMTVKVADVRLCHGRMLFVRAHPHETQEILLNTFLDIQDELREQVLLRPGLSIGGAWERADVSRDGLPWSIAELRSTAKLSVDTNCDTAAVWRWRVVHHRSAASPYPRVVRPPPFCNRQLVPKAQRVRPSPATRGVPCRHLLPVRTARLSRREVAIGGLGAATE